MKAGFQIEHQCPQCGAPAVLEETDRLFDCAFCHVRSFMAAADVFRYVLPHRAPDEDLFYFPYWRFRGAVYSCVPFEVANRFVDTTAQGVSSRTFPASLGVRAQAMKLRFAPTGTGDRFIPPAWRAAEARREVTRRLHDEVAQRIYHQEFIGETLSLIYAPFYIKDDRVFDAILNRPVAPSGDECSTAALPAAESADWTVKFIPTLCPDCGWDLAGDRASTALLCPHCRSIWQPIGEKLEPVPCGHFPRHPDTVAYLPFWRLEVVVTGLDLRSYADLVRAANLPKAVQPEWERQPFRYWCPAFKIQPEKFLRCASSATLAQPLTDAAAGVPDLPVGTITLPATEALEAAKCVLAGLVKPAQAFFPQLGEIAVEGRSALLALIPCARRGRELVNTGLRIAVSSDALQGGRNL